MKIKYILGLTVLALSLASCGKVKVTTSENPIESTKNPIESTKNPTDLSILTLSTVLTVSNTLELKTNFDGLNIEVSLSNDCLSYNNGEVTACKAGLCYITVSYQNQSDSISIMVENASDISSDPYENVNKDEFYQNYHEATSYMDAYYRTTHYLLSGTNSLDSQEPTIASKQPMENGKFVRNSSTIYSSDKKTYYIQDENGNIVDKIYESGAYITLEQVAPYLLAFNDVPKNYISSRPSTASGSPWGKYMRGNHSSFSGDTTKYPYEPVLPNISGCGGNYKYYEVDFGTTGTDCDPTYPALPYNDGKKITRGAARLVYARYDKKGNDLDINQKYVFYTYNHYNDFQEYLNYRNGFGKIFGNITGGGELSSKTKYAPTSYNEVILKNLNLKN